MGLQQGVRFPTGATPSWDAIRSQLTRVGETAVLRMIDGLPAFPDELPPEDWQELRVGTSGGMVTIRREPERLTCVVWGNDAPSLQACWRKVTWACAAAGGGLIERDTGMVTPDQFASEVDLSPA